MAVKVDLTPSPHPLPLSAAEEAAEKVLNCTAETQRPPSFL